MDKVKEDFYSPSALYIAHLDFGSSTEVKTLMLAYAAVVLSVHTLACSLKTSRDGFLGGFGAMGSKACPACRIFASSSQHSSSPLFCSGVCHGWRDETRLSPVSGVGCTQSATPARAAPTPGNPSTADRPPAGCRQRGTRVVCDPKGDGYTDDNAGHGPDETRQHQDDRRAALPHAHQPGHGAAQRARPPLRLLPVAQCVERAAAESQLSQGHTAAECARAKQ